MPKYKIARTIGEDKEVEADHYTDRPPFVDFERPDGRGGNETILRLRQDDISDIEIVG